MICRDVRETIYNVDLTMDHSSLSLVNRTKDDKQGADTTTRLTMVPLLPLSDGERVESET